MLFLLYSELANPAGGEQFARSADLDARGRVHKASKTLKHVIWNVFAALNELQTDCQELQEYLKHLISLQRFTSLQPAK